MFQIFRKNINIKEKEDIENGVFTIDGQINDALACNIIKDMLAFSNKYPKQLITLYINCEGGSVSAGMAIYDTICFLPNPVQTIAAGKAMGIGALLLAAGTQGMRTAHSNTEIALGQFWGKANMTQQNEMLDSVIKKVYGVLEKHTGRTEIELKEVSGSKVSMKPKEARKFGLIDKVV